MDCTQCGTGLSPDASFCNSCGAAAAQSPPAAPATMVIPGNWQQGVTPPGTPAPATQAIPVDWQKQMPPPADPGRSPVQPPPAPDWGAPTGTPAAATRKPVDYLLPAGGLLAVVASFLPWASVSFGPVSTSFAGTDEGRDGIITVVLGLLLLVLGVMRLSKGRLPTGLTVVAVLAAIGVLAVGVYDVIDVSGSADDLLEEAGGGADVGEVLGLKVSVGIGLYLEVVAGAVALAGAALGGRSSTS